MLRSIILAGNSRLDVASQGPPSIKMAPPHDDADAVMRIQKALVALGFKLPKSFPKGPEEDPDGKYGKETFDAVVAFQKREFPTDPKQWDGRVGQFTLARMDNQLPQDDPVAFIFPRNVSTTSNCVTMTPFAAVASKKT